MSQSDKSLRDKLRGEIQVTTAADLLPHQRRGALLIAVIEADILDVAEAIAADQTEKVAALLGQNTLYKPTLGQLSDWCVNLGLRFQYVILQPYVLAQELRDPSPHREEPLN